MGVVFEGLVWLTGTGRPDLLWEFRASEDQKLIKLSYILTSESQRVTWNQ